MWHRLLEGMSVFSDPASLERLPTEAIEPNLSYLTHSWGRKEMDSSLYQGYLRVSECNEHGFHSNPQCIASPTQPQNVRLSAKSVAEGVNNLTRI